MSYWPGTLVRRTAAGDVLTLPVSDDIYDEVRVRVDAGTLGLIVDIYTRNDLPSAVQLEASCLRSVLVGEQLQVWHVDMMVDMMEVARDAA